MIRPKERAMDQIAEYIALALELEQINQMRFTKSSLKRNNKLADRLRSIASQIESRKPEIKPEFCRLLFHDNANVRIWCAHHMLEVMRYGNDDRKQALEEIIRFSENKENRNSIGNRMWLEQWFSAHPEDRELTAFGQG